MSTSDTEFKGANAPADDRRAENEGDRVVVYKCPNCGGPLEFSIETQSWACKFCLGEFSRENFTPERLDEAPSEGDPSLKLDDNFFEGETREYACPSCGARVLAGANTTATRCAFCHNPVVLADKLYGSRRPDYIIPFSYTKESIRSLLISMASGRPFMPRSFKEDLQKGEIVGLYVPFWLFDATVISQIRGKGYMITTWSDSDYRYTKTDTYSVERAGICGFTHLPADGSKRMDDKVMQAIEPFDYKGMKEFSMNYLSGHYAENYDVAADTAFKPAYARMTAETEAALTAKGNYSRLTVDFRLHNAKDVECKYALLPVWLFTSTYKNKPYTFTVNGQTGAVTGSFPKSALMVLLWALGTLAVSGVLWTVLVGLLLNGGW